MRLRLILLAVLALSGYAILLRSIIGPFRLVWAVNSPLNAQSVFGLAMTAWILTARPGRRLASADLQPVRPLDLVALGLLTTAAFWPSLWFYFLADSLVHVVQSQWFTPELFTRGSGDGFFRPVGYLSLALNSRLAGVGPLLWHAPGLAAHVACSVLVFLIGRHLRLKRWACFVSAGIFAFHGTRPEAAVWIGGRFDLLAGFFVLLGLYLFLLWKETGARTAQAASLVSMLLGLLTKESAYVFPLLLLLLPRWKGKATVLACAPFFALAAGAFAWRWAALGGIGGYIDPRTGAPEALGISPLGMLKALALRIWSALYFPVNWERQPEIWLGAAMLLYLVSLTALAGCRPDGRVLLFALGLTLLPAVPPIHQLLIGADLQKSRLLYLPAAGFALLVGTALEGLASRRLALACGAGLLVFHYAALRHNLEIWGRVAALSRQTCDAAARFLTPETRSVIVQGLPGSLDGVYFFWSGFPECLQLASGFSRHDVHLDAPPGEKTEGILVLEWRDGALRAAAK